MFKATMYPNCSVMRTYCVCVRACTFPRFLTHMHFMICLSLICVVGSLPGQVIFPDLYGLPQIKTVIVTYVGHGCFLSYPPYIIPLFDAI
jgi:hypothetical protein